MAKVFEQENIQKLTDELQLVLYAIAVLTRDFNYYRGKEGNDVSFRAMDELKVEKIKLEAKIIALQEFLAGE